MIIYIDVYQHTTRIDQKTQLETIWSIVEKMKESCRCDIDIMRAYDPVFMLDFRYVDYGVTLMDPSMVFFRRFFYELFVYMAKTFYPLKRITVRVTGITIPGTTMEELFGDLDLRMLQRSAEAEVDRLFENAIPKE